MCALREFDFLSRRQAEVAKELLGCGINRCLSKRLFLPACSRLV
jgi:hypothetical protein